MARPKKKSKAEAGTLIQISCKYLAYPTDLQIYLMENWMGSLCHLSNASIAERKDAYRSTGKGLTYTDQQNALPSKRKANPALRMVHSQVCQDCLQRVDKAYQKFFDDIKKKKSGQKVNVGYPRFKKIDKYKSFTFPQVWMSVKDKKTGNEKRLEIVKFRPVTPSIDTGRVKFAHITLPGIGTLKIRLHRTINWDNAKTVTVKRIPSGDWYVSISVEMPLEPTLANNGRKTGVDVGLKKHAATSDGNYREHPKFLRHSEDKLKKQQRSLSKKKKGSSNYHKQKKVLAKTHEHIGSQREDFLHKLSLWLVITYAYIAFEKLNIPGMVKNPYFAQSILDAGWGTLIRFVTYKSVMLRGNGAVRVNPAYTTQDCSNCGCRVPKTLADRVHTCPQCGLVLCRDTNASRNIEHLAFDKGPTNPGAVSTVGTECPELVPISSEQTPVETGASAASAVAVSPVVEARKPRLNPYLSRG
jgi:putative transposase